MIPDGTTQPAAWFIWDKRSKTRPEGRGYLLTEFRRSGGRWKAVWRWYW